MCWWHVEINNFVTYINLLFFRLILIAEKDTVYLKFPTPLINRLEKHFVLTSSILEEWQVHLLDTFVKWISDFSRLVYLSEETAFLILSVFVTLFYSSVNVFKETSFRILIVGLFYAIVICVLIFLDLFSKQCLICCFWVIAIFLRPEKFRWW